MTERYRLALFTIALSLSMAGCKPSGGDSDPILRVGYQKWGTYSILKASGALEAKLATHGILVEWIEFPAGPPLLEALNAGSIDVGHTGDSPPLFAQAAGVPFVYVAASSPSPESSAILVPKASPIRDGIGLTGKRIGFTKGTSAHTLVVRSLEKHGSSVSEIEAVYLAPADGRAALASGSIDAWSIWDPYLSAAEHAGNVRRVVDGRGSVSGREYYLASRSFAQSQPEVLRTLLTELSRTKDWAKKSPGEVNRLLAEQTGLELAAVEKAESRRSRYDTQSITDELIAEQQSLADRYVELGLLPKSIAVKDAVLRIEWDNKE